ncbi:hypothetical protein [Nocardioides sp. TF02-7]|uniref:hypothetical protein n=1 Tax=Nocardioides sp. TF02-7 TaxID=2917724 RepID=UPI001F05FDDA|nr:hypothetical protein [Nocardioides sp. TF02-7]UMG92643.1 hypothetical protein MF408_23250 [Nocardioides sp. TF02-7]
MTSELAVPTWLAVATAGGLVVLLVAVAGLVLSVRRSRRRTEELLASAARDAEELRAQLTALEGAVAGRTAPDLVVRDDQEYVITDLGHDDGDAPALPAPVFADILLRESLIRTVSLAAGLRRALSPEVRHRIRAEMRREVKRARRQRRTDLRRARREVADRQRAAVPLTDVAG